MRERLDAVALVDLRGKDGALQVTTALSDLQRNLLRQLKIELPKRVRSARPAPERR